MDNEIIKARLAQYKIKTLEDEENALKEVVQELALYALSTTDFFTKAMFQGGTSLRILYGLPRFSEDLDFILNEADANFDWQVYIAKLEEVFAIFGLAPDISDRSKTSSAVKKLFLKDDSIGKVIHLDFNHQGRRKMLIKFEIDSNPPEGSQRALQYVNFPIDYTVTTQDLPSNFALKCHALLCRKYAKGRDWFDFLWYLNKQVKPNLLLLKNALNQCGPWEDQMVEINMDWLQKALIEKAHVIDWKMATHEVSRFVDELGRNSLKVWSADFFEQSIKQLPS